jgi:hypothetical protein
MAKRRKVTAKKSTGKSTKPHAKRAAAARKRTSTGAVPPQQTSFIDYFLKIFAPPDTGKRNGR